MTPSQAPSDAPTMHSLALPEVPRVQRPHPATALVRSWIALVALGFFFVREFLPEVLTGEYEDDPRVDFLGSFIFIGIGGVLLLVALSMLATWYFTRFVIDDNELRIETGAIWRSSRRIPFTKVQSVEVYQPLIARLVGLAELTIDAGADRPVRLRYLRRTEAYRFRDYLLARAHGRQVSLADTTGSESLLQDVDADDEVITRIAPGTLIVAALLTVEVFLAVVLACLLIIPPIVMGYGWAAPAGLIGVALSAIPYVNRVAVTQFNYVLARSERGVKITRGLTSLTSQTIPAHRIQTLRVSQPLLWRPLGLYRVDMDLVGMHSEDMEDSGQNGTSILMPAGTRAQVDAALSAIWPHADPTDVATHPSPRRARWFRPISGGTLRYGADDVLVVTASGVLRRTWEYAPHKRVQSVRIVQGPLQRRLGLADVQVHTVGRVVSMVAKHVSPDQAREFALSEADAAVSARSDGTGTELLDSQSSLGWPATSAAQTQPEQATDSQYPDPALGWPGRSAAPGPGLGFPHLPWR